MVGGKGKEMIFMTPVFSGESSLAGPSMTTPLRELFYLAADANTDDPDGMVAPADAAILGGFPEWGPGGMLE